ncbi:MAG TPA: hypothetical protein VHJ78_00330 [Actinomycetota bacterium]|nr:hypothetical protein [Actinomycetota bacterium]
MPPREIAARDKAGGNGAPGGGEVPEEAAEGPTRRAWSGGQPAEVAERPGGRIDGAGQPAESLLRPSHGGEASAGPEEATAARTGGARLGAAVSRAGRRIFLSESVPWPAVAMCGAYLLYMALRWDRIIEGVYWVSDAAWARVVTERPGSGRPGDLTFVGEAAHFSTLAFMRLTRGLPFHEQLWEITPLLMALAGAGLLGWTVAKLAGRWAGLLAFSVAASAAPPVLTTTLPEGMRSHTWFAMLTLAAVVVWLVRHGDELSALKMVGAAALTALGAGAALGSDPMFLGSGLLPFAVAGAAIWATDHRSQGGRNAGLAALGATAGAVLVAGAIARWSYQLGFRKTYLSTGYTFAELDDMLEAVKLAIGDVLLLANGYVLGRPVGLRSLVELGVGLAALISLALPPLLLRRSVAEGIRAGRFDRPRVAYLVFWVTVEAATLGSFILSSVAAGTGLGTVRYLIPLFFAVAATLPLWGVQLPWRRLIALGGATAFCLLSVSALRGDGLPQLYGLYNYEDTALPPVGDEIIDYLESRDVTRGYSNYWHSHALAYQSDLELEVNPVFECQRPQSKYLCPFFVNSRPGWFVPKEGPSFLIADSGDTGLPENTLISSPPWEELGPPVEQRQFGELTVYLYDFDIASKLDLP